KRLIESTHGTLIPETEFRTNGPATYYQIPGRAQRVGFIGAMTNMHFCENCNKLRLTCDGKLRPCLGSYLEFDIMEPLRLGANDEQLKQFFLNVVERKPREHDFRDNYQPNRKMIAIGGGAAAIPCLLNCHVERSKTSLTGEHNQRFFASLRMTAWER